MQRFAWIEILSIIEKQGFQNFIPLIGQWRERAEEYIVQKTTS